MRILHVDSATTWRGGQNQVLLAAHGMAERGHTVTIACQTGGALEARARTAGVPTLPLHFRGDLSVAALWHLTRTTRAAAFDVVHAHDAHALAALTLTPPRSWRVATRRVDFPLRSALSRGKYRRCARVVAVSHAIQRVLEGDGLPAERLRVVHDGVAARAPQPGGREALRALGVPDDALVVGNVAALTDHKDHATLVEAAALVVARVPRAHFVVLGDGELRDPLRALIRQRGLDERFVLAGFRDDVDALLPAFDVFCLSSHMEGLGSSLLDALMFGVPAVATRAGGIPEVVEDGVSGRLVPPRRPDLLASALADLLASPDERARLARGGQDRYHSEFGVSRMVEGTLAVYRERECASARS